MRCRKMKSSTWIQEEERKSYVIEEALYNKDKVEHKIHHKK